MNTLRDTSTRAQLIDRLQQLRPDSPRQWGKMSAHQMVCHLSDSFLLAMSQRTVNSAGNLVTRTFVRWIALHTPLTWPKGVKTLPEVDQEIGGTKPAEFGRDVEHLVSLMAIFVRPTRDFDWQVHPIFGRLSEREWLHWGYRHVDHHLRQFAL